MNFESIGRVIVLEGGDSEGFARYLIGEAGKVVDIPIGGFPPRSCILEEVRIVSMSRRGAEIRLFFRLLDCLGNAHLERFSCGLRQVRLITEFEEAPELVEVLEVMEQEGE